MSESLLVFVEIYNFVLRILCFVLNIQKVVFFEICKAIKIRDNEEGIEE